MTPRPAGETHQPEESRLGAQRPRLPGQIQPSGSAARRLAGGGVRPGPEDHLRGAFASFRVAANCREDSAEAHRQPSLQVENPSTPNDEGITPLHNAVCAGHHHIVKFLLDFGVNVNAADSDGW